MSHNDNSHDEFMNNDEFDKLIELLQNDPDYNNEMNMILNGQIDNDISSMFDLESTNTADIYKEELPPISPSLHNECNDIVVGTDNKNEYKLGLDSEIINKMKKRNGKNRCGECNCKLKLIDYTCKCDIKFCNKHRYPEDHYCDFDHKKKFRKNLEDNNPIVAASKVPQI